ncbi:MAG TPA: dTDP-4-dehydrorhamnose 3,5-epimerase family protein, partial [Pseudoxanthomonas sp.]|nr:dTDP-4-dehydrorhamnose 3,5-epimerase family protein [Pseudoxanthomonas sp.]
MKVIDSRLPECKILEPAVFGDERGYFFETWNAERFGDHGLPTRFVQSNISSSAR